MATLVPSEQPDAETAGSAAMEPSSRTVSPLVWILIAGAVVRAGLWFAWRDMPVRIVDAQSYNQLALGLLETGSYVSESGKLTSLRPPLYPVMVAGIYEVFGVENHAAVRAIQSAISLLLVVMVYVLGREMYSERLALWAAAGVCFYPSLLGFNNLVLSETIFTLFVVAVTMSVALALKRESRWWLVAVGLGLGFGALTRSILWLFAPLLSVYLFFVWKGTRLQRLAIAAVPFAVFVAVIAPWSIRNTRLHKTFTVIDVMGGRNAMMGNYEHTPLERSWATISIVKGEKQWFRVLQNETPNYSELTQGQIDKVAMRHGMKFALTHPGLTIKRDIVRFFNFWQLERTLAAGALQGIFGDIPKVLILPAAALICGTYALVLFSAVFGLLFTPPEDRRMHGLLLLTIVFPCIIHTLIFAHSRYHLPIIPILMLYSVAAILNRRAIWEARRTWKFRIGVAVCLVFVLAWVRELVFVDLHHLTG